MDNPLVCSCCGAPYSPAWKKDEDGLCCCPHCRAINDFGEVADNNPTRVRERDLARVYPMLENLEFDAAESALQILREAHPRCAQVYFLSALAANSVCYVPDKDDPSKRIPTLNNLTFTPLYDTEFVKKALALANSDLTRESYRQAFDYLEAKRAEILEAYNDQENQYDVFISTKVNEVDDNGKGILDASGKPTRSPEFGLAYDVYNYIRQTYPKLKVFFSESLEAKQKMAGGRYENIIYAALHSAKAFVLVGNSRKNIEWHWVRNEWKRYLSLINHDNDKKDHHFILVTQSLGESELPREIRGFNYVSYGTSTVTATKQLDAFLGRAFAKKSASRSIQARQFDDTVAPIEEGLLAEEEFQTVELGKGKGSVSAEIADEIASLAYAIKYAQEHNNPAGAKRAYEGLEELLKGDPDLYEARKLLLFKDTDYATPEAYFGDVAEILAHPAIFDSFLSFATKDDAEASLRGIADSLASTPCDGKPASFKLLSKALQSYVLPYRDAIGEEAIASLVSRIEGDLLSYEAESEDCQAALRAYFSLARYVDGKDPRKYVDRRMEYIGVRSKKPLSEKSRQFLFALRDEILAVNPKAFEALWSSLFFAYGKPVQSVEEFLNDALKAHYKDWLPLVGNQGNVQLFVSLLKACDAQLRPTLLELFLTLIVFDSQSYVKESDGILKPSRDVDGSGSIEDGELNGYDLFMKYVSYPLPSEPYGNPGDAAFASPSRDENGLLTLDEKLAPQWDEYLIKPNARPIDRLLFTFACGMHRGRFFDEAIALYELYLGQQESEKSLDCLVARFLLEMAKVRVEFPSDLRYVGRKPNMKPLQTDLVRAMKDTPAAEAIYASIEELLQDQENFYDTYVPIKKIVETLPVEWTVADIPALEKALKDIEDALTAIAVPNTRAQAEAEFAPIMGKLSRRIAELRVEDLFSKDCMDPRHLCRLDRHDDLELYVMTLMDMQDPATQTFAFPAERFDVTNLLTPEQKKNLDVLSDHSTHLALMKKWIQGYQKGEQVLYPHIEKHKDADPEPFGIEMNFIRGRYKSMLSDLDCYGDPAVNYSRVIAAIAKDFALAQGVETAREEEKKKQERLKKGWDSIGFAMLFIAIAFTLTMTATTVLGWIPASRMFTIDWHYVGIYEAFLTDFPIQMWLPMVICAGASALLGLAYALVYIFGDGSSSYSHEKQNNACWIIGGIPLLVLYLSLWFLGISGVISGIFLFSSNDVQVIETGGATFGTGWIITLPTLFLTVFVVSTFAD